MEQRHEQPEISPSLSREEKLALIKEGALPYKPFDPETEIERIRKMPKARQEEKREELKKFKERFAQQRIGMLRLHNAIEDAILENPDIPREKIEALCAEYAEELRLSPAQFARIEGVVDSYERAHEKVRRMRAKYPDDCDLFEEVTGVRPLGRIHIMETPVTLHFLCEDFRDYLAARGIEELTHEKYEPFTEEHGFKLFKHNIYTFGNVPGPIKKRAQTFSRAVDQGGPEMERLDKTQDHEAVHTVAEFFKYQKFYNVIEADQEALKVTKSAKEQKEIVGRIFRNNQSFLADMTGEEILISYAQNFAGRSVLFTAQETIVNYEGRYNRFIYSMSAECKHILAQLPSARVTDIIAKVSDMETDMYSRHYRDVLQGVMAVRRLENADFSAQDIVNMLLPENLKNWPNVVRRILNREKKHI